MRTENRGYITRIQDGNTYCRVGNFDYVTIKKIAPDSYIPGEEELTIVTPTLRPTLDAVNQFLEDYGYKIKLRSTVNYEECSTK